WGRALDGALRTPGAGPAQRLRPHHRGKCAPVPARALVRRRALASEVGVRPARLGVARGWAARAPEPRAVAARLRRPGAARQSQRAAVLLGRGPDRGAAPGGCRAPPGSPRALTDRQ